MVRGRRTRAAVILSTPRSIDDKFCASPKRKDCKLDSNSSSEHPIKTKLNGTLKSADFLGFTKTRSRAIITNYFQFQQKATASSDSGQSTASSSDGSEYAIDDNACDSFEEKGEQNIFLQAPVLHLNIDKSPNQASSIIINKHIDVISNFSGLAATQIGNNGIISFVAATSNAVTTKNQTNTINNVNHCLNNDHQQLSRSESSSDQLPDVYESSISSSDSNSCDSGVVADRNLDLSPSKRRKPTTPHRIMCPSPVKHAIVEKSPTSALSNLNIGTKKNAKTKRRLIVSNQIENAAMTAGVVQAGTAVQASFDDMPCPPKKAILNAAIDPSAQQNTTNNHNNINTITKDTKLTDFFPVRRSVRKTKKAVEQEQLRSIEAAIRNQQQDGLFVQEFVHKGRGIMASRKFTKGEFVIEYIGDLITMTEANKREQLYAKDENTGCYMYYFKHKSQQYCIDATAESGKLGRLVNHSRNGNLMTKTVFYRNRPHLVLLAKEDIEPGEELTYDYGDRSKESLLHHPWLAL